MLTPTVDGLSADGIPFCGVIYAGIMIRPDGSLSVLEYNVRLGDPEARSYSPPSAETSAKCARLRQRRARSVEWPGAVRTALGVVMASGGYPEAFEKGYAITGTDEDVPNTFVYHAGTKLNDAGQLVTNGGRVLTVVGLADDLPTARERAYARVDGIHFEKEHHRNDIGDKSLKRGK